jgi:mannose-6-phosphate isomerase-like protein (cupin superfamily)
LIDARDESRADRYFTCRAADRSFGGMNSTPITETFAGSSFTWLVTGEDLSLAEALTRPGAEPPVHIHAREDEVYYVLEGELTFQRGHELIEAVPGDAVVLPRGIQHGFAVRSETARVLFACTPGGLEEAFHAIAEPGVRGELPAVPAGPPPDEAVAAVNATFAEYGVTFTGPPLATLLASLRS